MGDLVNLKRFKKRAEREQSARQADANRAKFGRSKSERILERQRSEKEQSAKQADANRARFGRTKSERARDEISSDRARDLLDQHRIDGGDAS